MSEPRVTREDFSVCRLGDPTRVDLMEGYYFVGKTDEELSPVCGTCHMSGNAVSRGDGWRAFRVQDVLDFSLTGTLAKISSILTEEKIGIFVMSAYSTDYVLTREVNFDRALKAFGTRGYVIKDS